MDAAAARVPEGYPLDELAHEIAEVGLPTPRPIAVAFFAPVALREFLNSLSKLPEENGGRGVAGDMAGYPDDQRYD